MSPIQFLVKFFIGLSRPKLGSTSRSPRFDENYPDHINSWASRLKNSVEGLRDDSTDLQKKYENAPLRRKRKPTRKKREK